MAYCNVTNALGVEYNSNDDDIGSHDDNSHNNRVEYHKVKHN